MLRGITVGQEEQVQKQQEAMWGRGEGYSIQNTSVDSKCPTCSSISHAQSIGEHWTVNCHKPFVCFK